MRALYFASIGFAVSGVLGCGSSSGSPAADASSGDDGSNVDGSMAGDATDTDASDAQADAAPDAAPDADASDAADANDAADSGDGATSCAAVVEADAGVAACPAAGGPGSGQVRLYPCGLPSTIGDLDGGSTGDGGWALDGGHVFACMTLCNDITSCYVTPGTAPAVLVTCCP